MLCNDPEFAVSRNINSQSQHQNNQSYTMKFTAITAGLLTFSTLGQAAINLTWTPDEVGRIRIGDEIRVSWETDRTYDLEFKFVKWQRDGWKPITTSFQMLRQPAGEGGYVFEVPRVPHNK
ncbi:hypothetical protein D6D01_05795 [Aureobasidium pullulans]|uniref:Uncharacterized protein n=1 Tax=Aureobasidium pullulans TaxID=5580 RepID=A0A4S9L5S9_AURPU|nr:hypothetical protein D6D01_05795 [Aureobasidium pullulans]